MLWNNGLVVFVDFFDVDWREVAEVISIDQDDVDDVIIIDTGVDDVAFADEHPDDVVSFRFFGESVEAWDDFLKIGGASDLGQ